MSYDLSPRALWSAGTVRVLIFETLPAVDERLDVVLLKPRLCSY